MLELNQPIQNPALIKVMDAFKKEPSPRTELDMIAGLLSAKFLTPISLAKPVEGGQLGPDTAFQHYLITNNKDERFFLAFTDEDELKKWSGGEHRDAFTAPLPVFAALLGKSTTAKGVVINPFGQNITLTKEMIENFPKRRAALLKMVPPRFLIGKLKEEPEELKEALSKYFRKKQKSIQEAWLFTALREGTEKPRLMLIVDFDGEAEESKELFPLIGEAAKPYLKDDQGLDIVRRDDKFAADLMEKTEPFYRKKTGLFW